MKLFEFAFCGRVYLRNLAQKATPENWSSSTHAEYDVLRNYLDYTFRKLFEENNVIETDDCAYFNTGLFTQHHERIYAFFNRNTNRDAQKWHLQSFSTEYEMKTAMRIDQLPPRASYFSDPSDLIFDTRKEIVLQYEHIFGDRENFARLPVSVRNFDEIMRRNLFDGAIKSIYNRLEENYRIAIPQFHNGKIQLLLPLYLTESEKPDLALVCEKNSNEYLGSTCLTLGMAYSNARLIAKPESSWLLM